jgi:hypothetical protein
MYGQNLARKVSFSYNRLALKLVLDDISADHDVYFVYSPDYIPTTQPITISVSNIALSEALDKLFDPLPVAYKPIGGQIVLRPVEKNPPPRITNKTIPKEIDQHFRAPYPSGTSLNHGEQEHRKPDCYPLRSTGDRFGFVGGRGSGSSTSPQCRFQCR